MFIYFNDFNPNLVKKHANVLDGPENRKLSRTLDLIPIRVLSFSIPAGRFSVQSEEKIIEKFDPALILGRI